MKVDTRNTGQGVLQPVARPRGELLRRILICLDRSCFAEAVLPYAVALARSFGCRLHLVHVLESTCSADAPPPDTLAWQFARAEAEEYLARVAGDISSKRVPVETAVLQGHAAEQILCFTDREEVDLILLSSHGEKGPTEWRLASTAEKVLTRARASVLVVPVAGAQARPARAVRLERILVPLDGSPRAETILPLLERLALTRPLVLVLLHAIAAPELLQHGPPSAEDVELQHRVEQRNQRVARRYLDEIRDRLVRAGCDARVIVEKGDLRSVLPQVAERERIDLVALTAHGRTGSRSTCLGSTAGHLVRHAGLPILMFQNLPQKRSEFAAEVRHRREMAPLRGEERLEQP